jgi:hypothetical protein
MHNFHRQMINGLALGMTRNNHDQALWTAMDLESGFELSSWFSTWAY